MTHGIRPTVVLQELVRLDEKRMIAEYVVLADSAIGGGISLVTTILSWHWHGCLR
jgi:hypothetical protein